jgi:molybdopterin converting factor small subunit
VAPSGKVADEAANLKVEGWPAVKVTVKLGAPLSQVVGESKIVLHLAPGSTVGDVIAELQARYPDFESGLRGKGLCYPLDQILYQLFVNARPVPFDQASSTALHDGDRLYLFLPVAGG